MTDESDSIYFAEKYRIPSTRLRGKNYADAGMYYVTMCTKNRTPWFGNVRDGQMRLTDVGRIVMENWMSIPNHFSHVRLDKFVIMPDHMHGIIRIVSRMVETCDSHVSKQNNTKPHVDMNIYADVHDSNPETCESHVSTKKIPRPTPGSLGSIINQFKSICTKHIRKTHPDFAWQPRYYDHVIRDEQDLERIRWYIKQNPIRWNDEFKPIPT